MRGSRSPRILAGQIGIVNHEVIPSVVYTMPEIAGVGLTEEDAKAARPRGQGRQVPDDGATAAPRPTARATASSRSIADAKSDRVLGVWIIASVAGTMIAEAAQAMEFGATSEDIAYTCHAHPTHSRGDQGSGDGGDRQADPHLRILPSAFREGLRGGLLCTRKERPSPGPSRKGGSG